MISNSVVNLGTCEREGNASAAGVMGPARNALKEHMTSEPNARHSLALVLKYVKDAKAIPMVMCGSLITHKKSCAAFAAKGIVAA